jgi:nucleoside-diphosphate-sugar epimerase
MMRVLLTGATGFVGSALSIALAERGYLVRAALRVDRPLPRGCAEKVIVGDISPDTEWGEALRDVDGVVHAAARAHAPDAGAANAELCMRVNAGGTQQLADSAAAAGITRFVFLSSVKVNGERTVARPYAPTDEPRPQDAYGVSKWTAERHLTQLAARTPMRTAIVRAPLVYGPGVRANFLRLMRWIDKERPLPLGAVDNTRSLVSIWNLCDLLVDLLQNPVAPGRVWMVSDGEDLSTSDLVRRIGYAMGRRVRLLPVPITLLRMCGGLIGRQREIARLCDSLRVDIEPTRLQLRWAPLMTVDEALIRTVAWYMTEGRGRES